MTAVALTLLALLLAYEIKRHWREFMDAMQRQAKDMDR